MPNTYTESSLTTLAALKAILDPPPLSGLSKVTASVGGTSYTSATGTIIDAKGSGGAISPVIVGGVIVDWTISATGRDYLSPTIVVTGDGSGAAAVAAVGADAILSALIARISAILVQFSNRPVLFDSGSNITEVRNGNGQSAMMTKVYPIVGVTSLSIDGQIIPAATGATDAGYVFEGGVIHLRGYRFTRGVQNVTVVYRGGVAQSSQEQALLEQACLQATAYVWKKRPYLHVTSDAQPQGMGTLSIVQKDFPDDVWSMLRQVTQVAPIV